ncbi:MAG: hypothetical protein CMF59_19535 [Leptospiraceae bacterium]|nr:hypothetical protein [Leptospiraceae bacterium]
MDLAGKLSLYGKPGKPSGPAATGHDQDKSGESVRAGLELSQPSVLTFSGLEFSEISPDLYFRREVYEDLQLGDARLSELLVQPMQFLDDLLPVDSQPATPAMIHRNEVLFLDTETTGLGRGPGNFPFLYGLAWISEQGLIFEQYFLNGPGAEESFHQILRDLVSRFSAICSYNGKSFDIPLIRNRFILLGERFRAPPVHLDLFHFWRSVGGGMRKKLRNRSSEVGKKKGFKQKNMEEEVLAFYREDDLPGSEVPQVYFDFRKYGRNDRMHLVMKHNEWDLQGLALLFLKAIGIVNEQRDQVSLYRSGIARMFLRHGRSQESLEILQDITAKPSDEGYLEELLYGDRLLLGLLLKKAKRYEEADLIFEGLFRKYRCMQSCIELSRYKELRCRDLSQALSIAREGLDLLEFRGVEAKDRYYQDLIRRTRRLENRLHGTQSEANAAQRKR